MGTMARSVVLRWDAEAVHLSRLLAVQGGRNDDGLVDLASAGLAHGGAWRMLDGATKRHTQCSVVQISAAASTTRKA